MQYYSMDTQKIESGQNGQTDVQDDNRVIVKIRDLKENDWKGTCDKCHKEFNFEKMLFFPNLKTMICYDDLKKENKIAWEQNEVE